MTQHFLAGILFCLAIESLIEDLVGKERYLVWVAANWEPATSSVPLALFILIIAYGLYRGG